MPYIILYRGIEYNDEIYSVGGEGSSVEKNGFTNLPDAVEALKEKYKDFFKPYISTSSYSKSYDYSTSVGEFSYDNDERGWDLARQLGMIDGDNDDYVGPHYHELIAAAEEKNVEWLEYMPQLFDIVEVNFDGN